MRYIFFRNDDLRQTLDDSLVRLTDMFTSAGIPICHAVEPANVGPDVVAWLVNEKKKNPALIEIVQHGYDHKLKYQKTTGGKLKKGEFGGDRSYKEQFDDIYRGRKIMDTAFWGMWFPLFTFPFGGRNEAALQAIANNFFKVVNGSMGTSVKERIFYAVGRKLNREMLFGRKVSWNLRYRRNFQLFQIDTAVSLINHFIDEDTACEFHQLPEVIEKVHRSLEAYLNVGIVLHHRYHVKEEHFKLVADLIDHLKTLENVEFVTQEFLYRKFGP